MQATLESISERERLIRLLRIGFNCRNSRGMVEWDIEGEGAIYLGCKNCEAYSGERCGMVELKIPIQFIGDANKLIYTGE